LDSEISVFWVVLIFCFSVIQDLLSFGAESVVLQVAIQKLKDQDI
jgi:hypothetical protein